MANVPFFEGVTSGSLRNNFSGWVGCRFIPEVDLSVTDLGHIWVTGNSGSVTVEILRVSDLAVIATASVSLASGTNDTYNYASITPVSLQKGVQYYLVSNETNGGNQWRDSAAVPGYLDLALVDFSAFSSNKTSWNLQTANQTYVPPNFKYDDSTLGFTSVNDHWAEAVNVTVNDTTGGIKNTGGGGSAFDASGRVEQMWDGVAPLVCEFTINTTTAMAFGIYAATTPYTPGGVTVASILGGWEINGGNALVKESGTTRFTQNSVSVGDVFRVTLTLNGRLVYRYNGAVVFTSAISTSTVLGWRPWRIVGTFSAANAELTPCVMLSYGPMYDPDTAANHVVMELPQHAAIEVAAPAYDVHWPESAGTGGGGAGVPFSRAWVG